MYINDQQYYEFIDVLDEKTVLSDLPRYWIDVNDRGEPYSKQGLTHHSAIDFLGIFLYEASSSLGGTVSAFNSGFNWDFLRKCQEKEFFRFHHENALKIFHNVRSYHLKGICDFTIAWGVKRGVRVPGNYYVAFIPSQFQDFPSSERFLKHLIANFHEGLTHTTRLDLYQDYPIASLTLQQVIDMSRLKVGKRQGDVFMNIPDTSKSVYCGNALEVVIYDKMDELYEKGEITDAEAIGSRTRLEQRFFGSTRMPIPSYRDTGFPYDVLQAAPNLPVYFRPVSHIHHLKLFCFAKPYRLTRIKRPQRSYPAWKEFMSLYPERGIFLAKHFSKKGWEPRNLSRGLQGRLIRTQEHNDLWNKKFQHSFNKFLREDN